MVGPLAPAAEPHAWDLCEAHAARITAPLGWELLRVTDINTGPENDDDLTALAEAVREVGRNPSGLQTRQPMVGQDNPGRRRAAPQADRQGEPRDRVGAQRRERGEGQPHGSGARQPGTSRERGNAPQSPTARIAADAREERRSALSHPMHHPINRDRERIRRRGHLYVVPDPEPPVEPEGTEQRDDGQRGRRRRDDRNT